MTGEYERVIAVKDRVTERLLAIPDVDLVAVGAKWIGDEPTERYAIHVYVREKLPPDQVPPDRLIPAEIDGVPTDVFTGGEVVPLAGPPPPGSPPSTVVDDARLRPVCGGTRIRNSAGAVIDNKAVFPQPGTLGCLLWDKNNHDIGYALTCMHVLTQNGQIPDPVKNDTKIGSPTGTYNSTCSDDIIGKFAAGKQIKTAAFVFPPTSPPTPAPGGRMIAQRDEAVVKLNGGMTWVAEIQGLATQNGKPVHVPVKGAFAITAMPAPPPPLTYRVRKYGVTTLLTGGTLVSFLGTSAEAQHVMVIRPNARADGKTPSYFADEGDSGSALVNDDDQVIGVVYARQEPSSGAATANAYALHIEQVLARLSADLGVTLEVASATALNQVHTVPGGSLTAVPEEMAAQLVADPSFLGRAADDRVLAPVARPWFAEGRPSEEAIAAVRDGLRAAETGGALLTFFDIHRDELLRLIGKDRRVTIAWHRGGGAAVLQRLLRMAGDPGLALPETVNGIPVMECAYRLADVLAARGSTRLAADLEHLRAVLPELGGRTLPEIMIALRYSTPGAVPEEAGHA